MNNREANEHMGVSKNHGTPKSSILIRFSIINHPFWGTPTFGNTQMNILLQFACFSFTASDVVPKIPGQVRKAQDATWLDWNRQGSSRQEDCNVL